MSIEISCDAKGIEEIQRTMRNFDSAMQRRVHAQLVSWVADVKASARRKVPVRTGYLRSKIYAEIREWVALIGAKAAYAFFVEFGTRKMRARPFLYPAIQEHLPRLEQIILDALDAAKAEAGL